MEIRISKDELQNMLKAAAEVGVRAYIAQATPKDDRISQREAFKQYGCANVRRWIREHKLSGVRCAGAANSPIYYSHAELAILLQSERNIILN